MYVSFEMTEQDSKPNQKLTNKIFNSEIVFIPGSKSKGKSKKKEPMKKRRNAKLNQEEEAIEESDEGDFDDRELDYITDSGERYINHLFA